MKTDEEIEALAKRVAEREAKQREAEERAEKAEYERDEARARLRRASVTVHERTCANATADNWQDCPSKPCQADRAALGERP